FPRLPDKLGVNPYREQRIKNRELEGSTMTFSRRQFLGNASLAAAAAAVSSIPVLGSELRRTVGPNDRLRIATIGVKGRGMDHLNQWLKMADAEGAATRDMDARGA